MNVKEQVDMIVNGYNRTSVKLYLELTAGPDKRLPVATDKRIIGCAYNHLPDRMTMLSTTQIINGLISHLYN